MAILFFRELVRGGSQYWYDWYGLGEAHSYLSQYSEAINCLEKAAELGPCEPTVFLALGIAQQLAGRDNPAVDSLLAAIKLDEDLVLAYNSLAFTQLQMGELGKALHNYDAGVKAITRRFVRGMHNGDEPRAPQFPVADSGGRKWLEYAEFGALFHASTVLPVDRIAWLSPHPVGDDSDSHDRGLLFRDAVDASGRTTRTFLPPYFASFHEALQRSLYGRLLAAQGLVLGRLGRVSEGEACFLEARAFGFHPGSEVRNNARANETLP